MSPQVNIHHIPSSDDVTQIDMFCVKHPDGQYQITIRCWDHAWTAYRECCGFETIEQYFTEMWFENGFEEHLVNLFLRAKHTKAEEKWLRKIMKNICVYLKNLDSDSVQESAA